MKFDPKKPHGTVIGMDGVAFEQDGQLYTAEGEPFVDQQELALDKRQPSAKNAAGGKNVAS
jgi:hypothetical protein